MTPAALKRLIGQCPSGAELDAAIAELCATERARCVIICHSIAKGYQREATQTKNAHIAIKQAAKALGACDCADQIQEIT